MDTYGFWKMNQNRDRSGWGLMWSMLIRSGVSHNQCNYQVSSQSDEQFGRKCTETSKMRRIVGQGHSYAPIPLSWQEMKKPYQCRNSYFKDNWIIRPSYLHSGNSYIHLGPRLFSACWLTPLQPPHLGVEGFTVTTYVMLPQSWYLLQVTECRG